MLSGFIVRRLVQYRHAIHVNRNITAYTKLYQNQHPNAFNIAEQNKADLEIKEALDIETSLFDNSRVQHDPTPVGEVMRKNKFIKKPLKSLKPLKSNAAKPIAIVHSSQTAKTKAKPREPPRIINDSELGVEFARLTLGDNELANLMTTIRSRKRRDKQREIIIEGRRLIEEALDCGLTLQTLIFSQRNELEKIQNRIAVAQKSNGSKIYKVAHHDLKTWSTLTTPPGLLAIFKRPSDFMETLKTQTQSMPVTVICDNIREPNNLGSIIRTCAALPCMQIVVTRGCCDPWDSKALRGGCGGHFRVPIQDDIDWRNVPLCIPPEFADDCCIFIAENNVQKLNTLKGTSVVSYDHLQKTGAHNVLIIGGESHGISEEAYKFMSTVGVERGKCLYIPLADGIDSLNVSSALTLLLFELRKQLLVRKEYVEHQTSTDNNEVQL